MDTLTVLKVNFERENLILSCFPHFHLQDLVAKLARIFVDLNADDSTQSSPHPDSSPFSTPVLPHHHPASIPSI